MGIIFTDNLKPEEKALTHNVQCASDDGIIDGEINRWKDGFDVLFYAAENAVLRSSELEAIAAKMRELEAIK